MYSIKFTFLTLSGIPLVGIKHIHNVVPTPSSSGTGTVPVGQHLPFLPSSSPCDREFAFSLENTPVLDISRRSEHTLHVPPDQLRPSLLLSRPVLAMARATTPLLRREEYSSLVWPRHILPTVHADGHLGDSPLPGTGKGAARNTFYQ